MTVESIRSLDVNRLNREGCLEPGYFGLWHWTRDGEKVSSINLRAEEDCLHLSFRHRSRNGDWADMKESVRIIRTACNLGGTRPWFECPGVVNGIACRRKVSKLYGAGRYFLCRHCHGLAYGSQREEDWQRAQRRANGIRRRLGGEPGTGEAFPERPKGMWQRTYDRLCDEIEEAEQIADDAFVMRAAKLLNLWNNTDDKRSFWS